MRDSRFSLQTCLVGRHGTSVYGGFAEKGFYTKSNRLCFTIAALLFVTLFTSCEKNFDIKVQANQPMLVVEAYINNETPSYNYVILSRSLDYLSLDFQSTPVTDATVTITEGERAGSRAAKWGGL